MSSSSSIERLWKIQASMNKLILDGGRDPERVADILQAIIDEKRISAVSTLPESVPALTEKFALLVDLGILTVPADYCHARQLESFREQNRQEFFFYNDNITDRNFPNPTRVLKPGDKLRARAFKQIVGGTTTSEERMAFLATQKAIYVGAQGASLVWDQKRDQLPKGKQYASFDEPDRLWQDAVGRHWVPRVGARSDGAFSFRLGCFGKVWRGGDAFLCFCDVE